MTIDKSNFMIRVTDIMEKLGWEPYEVRAVFVCVCVCRFVGLSVCLCVFVYPLELFVTALVHTDIMEKL